MDPAIVAEHLQAVKSHFIRMGPPFPNLPHSVLTLGQEVERIWMRRFSYVTMLYLINRYATLMQFIVIVTAFNDPYWRGEPCKNFVLFEGICTVVIIAVGQMIMILRVVAIYERSKRIFIFLFFLWAFQIVISAAGLRTGYSVSLPPGFVGCILTGHGTLFPSVWISPLVTNSCIFLLTIFRTKHYIHHLLTPFVSEASAKAIMILVCDGTMYFFLIFLANLMNALIYFLAEPDLKEIGASFSPLLTSTVISRLVLNLRSLSDDSEGTTTAIEDSIVFSAQRCHPNNLGTRASERQFQSTSIWPKALDNVAEDESSSPSDSGYATVDDIPLQQLGATHSGKDRNDDCQ